MRAQEGNAEQQKTCQRADRVHQKVAPILRRPKRGLAAERLEPAGCPQRSTSPEPAPIWHIIWQMRTTLDLDDALIDALRGRHPGVSRTEAIEIAVRFYLATDAVSRLRRLAGSLEVEDVSGSLRDRDRRS